MEGSPSPRCGEREAREDGCAPNATSCCGPLPCPHLPFLAKVEMEFPVFLPAFLAGFLPFPKVQS